MRTYGEVIDVRTTSPGSTGTSPASVSAWVEVRPGAPEQFLWRGRLYLVRDVLAQWIELGTWWSVRGPAERSEPRSVDRVETSATRPSERALPPPRSVATDVGAVEREVWRVEASAGRSATSGVYDLVRDVPAPDPSTGLPLPGPARWRLARALD